MKLKIVIALACYALSAVSIPAVAQSTTPAYVSAIFDQSDRVGTRQVHYLRAGSSATTTVLPSLTRMSHHSMGLGEAELEAGLKARGARNVCVAIIAGHWIAEEQPAITADLIATFAAGVR